MRHRIGMILAVVMAGVMFFPGAWVICGCCAFPSRQRSCPSYRLQVAR